MKIIIILCKNFNMVLIDYTSKFTPISINNTLYHECNAYELLVQKTNDEKYKKVVFCINLYELKKINKELYYKIYKLFNSKINEKQFNKHLLLQGFKKLELIPNF